MVTGVIEHAGKHYTMKNRSRIGECGWCFTDYFLSIKSCCSITLLVLLVIVTEPVATAHENRLDRFITPVTRMIRTARPQIR
jgi:hypothetical protein